MVNSAASKYAMMSCANADAHVARQPRTKDGGNVVLALALQKHQAVLFCHELKLVLQPRGQVDIPSDMMAMLKRASSVFMFAPLNAKRFLVRSLLNSSRTRSPVAAMMAALVASADWASPSLAPTPFDVPTLDGGLAGRLALFELACR